jgi:2,4-diketo-3-deoxy-L-fuconate hydrolase
MGKFICIGLNYADHAAESGLPVPAEPILFMKHTSTAVGANDRWCCRAGPPRPTGKWSWASSSAAPRATCKRREALCHVAGYCVVNDVSEREYQLERGGTWDKGKGCDTFGPIGPWLVTADEVPDPQNLHLWLEVNGQRRQNGSTKTMIFGVAQLVSYVSRFMTLPRRPDHHRHAARCGHGCQAPAGVS